MTEKKEVFTFELDAYYNEISPDLTYRLMGLVDIPPAERVSIKKIGPLRNSCPYSESTLGGFRTMKQPSSEWLDARASFLTTSRFPIIAGEQPGRFGTPLQYWREITGRALAPPQTPISFSNTSHGTRYEAEARQCYKAEFGVEIQEEGLRLLDEVPWIYTCSTDGLINNKPKHDGIVEIKCNALGDPRDYVPYHYVPQMMGAMAVYDAPFCDFINYWVREDLEERVFYCCRVYNSRRYWEFLKIRLDYMAWCIVNDRAPVGMGELALAYPLPMNRVKVEERCLKVVKINDFLPTPPPPPPTPLKVKLLNRYS